MSLTTVSDKILVVDDDPFNLQFVTRTLARAGFATAAAVDGDEALDAIRTGWFDVVVSDVRMARLSGIQLLQNIRVCFPSLPVILMTGLIEDDIREAAAAWEATAVFEKPVNGADLIVTVRLALRKSARSHTHCEAVGTV